MQPRLPRGRKQRSVKNAYIDIDSVTICPGNDYCHWIKIAKTKLKEREKILLQEKTKKMELIINRYSIQHFVMKQEIIDNALTKFNEMIDLWRGLNLQHTRRQITRFRDYFDRAKNWRDQRKRTGYGAVFWVPLFKYIEKNVPHESYKEMLCFGYINYIWKLPNFSNVSLPPMDIIKMIKRYYSDHTTMTYLKALFEGTVRFNNTRPMPLINWGIIKRCSDMKSYLLQLHPSLDIDKWIKEEAPIDIIINKWIQKRLIDELDVINESIIYMELDINKTCKRKLNECIDEMDTSLDCKPIVKKRRLNDTESH